MIEFELKRQTNRKTGHKEIIRTNKNFTIVANGTGIKFTGFSNYFKTKNDLDDFALAVAHAWVDHEKLKPKVEVVQNVT